MRIPGNIRPADSITIFFLLCLMTVSLAFHKNLPHAPKLIFMYSLLLFFQFLLVILDNRSLRSARNNMKRLYADRRPNSNKFMDYTRGIVFPVICVLIIFDSLEWLVHYINPKDIDPLLVNLDYLLFNGYHPTVMLEAIQTPFLTDMLQISYSTYYFLPIGLGILLKMKGMGKEFEKTLFLLLLCFYLSYIGYMLFPALGPRYTMNHLQSSELKGFFAAEIIQETLNRLEGIKRDAFPSGHTGVALVVSALAYRFSRGFFYVTLPVITMLIFSTVYCRYHYVVDVIGGIILALVTFIIGEKYYAYWENSKDTDS